MTLRIIVNVLIIIICFCYLIHFIFNCIMNGDEIRLSFFKYILRGFSYYPFIYDGARSLFLTTVFDIRRNLSHKIALCLGSRIIAKVTTFPMLELRPGPLCDTGAAAISDTTRKSFTFPFIPLYLLRCFSRFSHINREPS